MTTVGDSREDEEIIRDLVLLRFHPDDYLHQGADPHRRYHGTVVNLERGLILLDLRSSEEILLTDSSPGICIRYHRDDNR